VGGKDYGNDGADAIGKVHLEAALELWIDCADSAAHIFGDALGDDVADLGSVASLWRRRDDTNRDFGTVFSQSIQRPDPNRAHPTGNAGARRSSGAADWWTAKRGVDSPMRPFSYISFFVPVRADGSK
jgi:hypothetical protein